MNDQTKNFLMACRGGNLEWAIQLEKYYPHIGKIDIHFNYEEPFRISCEYGHLHIAKWLYSLGNIDIAAQGHYAFYSSCRNKHIEVANWLHSIEPTYYYIEELNSHTLEIERLIPAYYPREEKKSFIALITDWIPRHKWFSQS